MRHEHKITPAEKPYCQLLEPSDPKNFASKKLWELSVARMVREASEYSTSGAFKECVQDAIANNWWGAIYPNGTITPYGLSNYLAELYSWQIWGLDIWSVRPEELKPSRSIEEFDEERRAKFRNWLQRQYLPKIQHSGRTDITEIDSRHVEAIKSVRLFKQN